MTTKKHCIIESCEELTASRYTLKEGSICSTHWFKLPLKMRVRYWNETDYGKKEPNAELVKAIRDALNPVNSRLAPL